jgi:hypothetical protein
MGYPELDPDLARALEVLHRVFAPDPPHLLTVAPLPPQPAPPAPTPGATQPRLPDLPPAPSTSTTSTRSLP